MKSSRPHTDGINMIDVVNRLKQSLNMQTDVELANSMNVPAKKVSVWKSRNTVPTEKLAGFCLDKGLDLQFILTGKKIQETLQNPSGNSYSAFPELETIYKETDMLWKCLDQSKRFELASKILMTITDYKKKED